MIEAWGKVEVGRQGFRARYARLVALSFDDASEWSRAEVSVETLEQLGRLYRVPVFHSRREMQVTFPPVDVDELLGTPKRPIVCADCGATVPGESALAEHRESCRPPLSARCTCPTCRPYLQPPHWKIMRWTP